MRSSLPIFAFMIASLGAFAQGSGYTWFSENSSDGILIQNSFPKGGPYLGPTDWGYNHSYLVFFSHVVNENDFEVELDLNFSADSLPVPDSPDTFVKFFLPSETMTADKQDLFSYGLTELESLSTPTEFYQKLGPEEECYLYVVVIFYQTKAEAFDQYRGGNRAELILKDGKFIYNMPPQADLMPCGRVKFDE